MRILFLLFLALCLAVIITITLASLNLVYLIWYISAFIIFFSGMFWLREVLTDRQKDRENGKHVQQQRWHKNSTMRSGFQLIGLFFVFLYAGIIRLGTTEIFMPIDSFIAFFGCGSLTGIMLIAFGALATVRDSMKLGDKAAKKG